MIVIDGSMGEGGGQILRSALTLSAMTGQPFRIEKIRAKRKKPGLMRQHLTCVNAAAEICGGHVEGAEIGSKELTFTPGDVRSGSYDFSVGTAGSCNLVFQTVLPALLSADEVSFLSLKGGTHNPESPSYEVISESFLPALATADVNVEATLHSRGFYPAGGGKWQALIHPSDRSRPIELLDRGKLKLINIEAMVSNLPGSIAERELAACKASLDLPEECLHLRTYETAGPGNAVVARLEFDARTEVFVAFGQHRVTAEKVADRLVQMVQSFLNADAAVGYFLADQLLLPLALGAGGRFTTVKPSKHFMTNCDVINEFLDVEISSEEISSNTWSVVVET